ncbi:tryptophan synthase subunit alpha [Listeria seeligeri]|uniref:tryptophan synthase subunit alpha n=1 Tax=Listeria seeligeri TaxID=1640 RepID=UPI00162A7E8A|nr:tryptophan synthase subunit alpha [Listeria seeligeri]MBC1428603.1 tryptophan synthase subunit alpha [Listeria seeligeri]MBC1534260.1 tryptophan synthase subunit alpha [Listeria seeligeri]MBC1741193.1 tryptophan synthase subunit alpha [Listeria seeligeri]MBC1746786.1 tryptophan synthase subunit alpha [Listeria seeligeri]MBC1749556.1 tryptophan synthase subunit alpha [Listeria seeligeri]
MNKTLTEKLSSNKEHPAIVTYIMGGDGGLDHLEEQLLFLEKSGVSAIEIGIPFSDPVADGPVIQLAGLRALKERVSLEQILTKLASSKVQIPLIIMSYINPIFHLGIPKFVELLKNTPVKGLIIPDLPFEHQNLISPELEQTDIALIPLVSLTSPKERLAEITKHAEGFIYAVTVNGTTGVRSEFDTHIDTHLAYLKSISLVPVLAGFGVSSIEHVEKFAHVCDGVIIGSKVVQMLHEKNTTELGDFLKKAANVRIEI